MTRATAIPREIYRQYASLGKAAAAKYRKDRKRGCPHFHHTATLLERRVEWEITLHDLHAQQDELLVHIRACAAEIRDIETRYIDKARALGWVMLALERASSHKRNRRGIFLDTNPLNAKFVAARNKRIAALATAHPEYAAQLLRIQQGLAGLYAQREELRAKRRSLQAQEDVLIEEARYAGAHYRAITVIVNRLEEEYPVWSVVQYRRMQGYRLPFTSEEDPMGTNCPVIRAMTLAAKRSGLVEDIAACAPGRREDLQKKLAELDEQISTAFVTSY